MVVGQETYHNHQPLAGTGEFAAWGDQVGRFIAFDYGYDGSGRTPTGEFWRAFEEIRTAFNLPSRRALAWTNVCKVQQLEGDSGSFSVMAQTPLVGSSRPVAANKIIEWQREMIERELDFIAPDIVLFLSGSMGWFTRNTFAGYSEEEITMNGGSFKRVTWLGASATMVQTYHPNARVDRKAQDRAAALQYVREQVGLG